MSPWEPTLEKERFVFSPKKKFFLKEGTLFAFTVNSELNSLYYGGSRIVCGARDLLDWEKDVSR